IFTWFICCFAPSFDCKPDECCLELIFSKLAFCEPKYQPGQRCPDASIYKVENDLFKVACPCVGKYVCVKISSEKDVTLIKDSKCIFPKMYPDTCNRICQYIIASSRREAGIRNGLEVSPNGSRVNRYVTISSAMQSFPSEIYSVLHQRNRVTSLSSSASIS
ncbi:u19-Nephitoxin-Nsp1a_1, partial [Trichonephila inaurata madagascariensis]